MKAQPAGTVLAIHAIEHQCVDVDVQIERRPKPLNDCHDQAAPVRHALSFAGPSPQDAEHGAHEHADHRAAQRVISSQHIPNPRRQAQHPLADGDLREHMID